MIELYNLIKNFIKKLCRLNLTIDKFDNLTNAFLSFIKYRNAK